MLTNRLQVSGISEVIEDLDVIASQHINSRFIRLDFYFLHFPLRGRLCCWLFDFCRRDINQFGPYPGLLRVCEKNSKRAASSNFRNRLAKFLCLNSCEAQDSEGTIRSSRDQAASSHLQSQQLRFPEVRLRNTLEELRVLCFFA